MQILTCVLGCKSGGGLYEYYSGLIDDVYIYDRALSAEEVQARTTWDSKTKPGG